MEKISRKILNTFKFDMVTSFYYDDVTDGRAASVCIRFLSFQRAGTGM